MVRPEHDADRGCHGKLQHATREEAHDHKMGLVGKKRFGKRVAMRYGQRVDVYQCPSCGFWHVGHQTGRQKRRKKMGIRKHYE